MRVKLTASLSAQIESDLLHRLHDSRPGDRFPSETQIASEYDVSRVTVREALASLERRGLIIRRQGIGTFVNRRALQIHTRLDESFEFGALIRASGHRSSVAQSQARIDYPGVAAARRLHLTRAQRALIVHKVFSADGVPVIYVINAIPLQLIPPDRRERSLRDSLATEPIYDFLAESCGQHVTYQIADIAAVTASRSILAALRCRAGAPVLNINEAGYTAGDVPVFYSQEYYKTDLIRFQLLRRPGG